MSGAFTVAGLYVAAGLVCLGGIQHDSGDVQFVVGKAGDVGEVSVWAGP